MVEYVSDNLEDIAYRHGSDPDALGRAILARGMAPEFLEYMEREPRSLLDRRMQEQYKKTAESLRAYYRR